MIRVYIAGPIGENDAGRPARVEAALVAGAELLRHGFAPFVPHFSHFWQAAHDRSYEDWMRYDAVWISLCAAVLRLPGRSPGADREVAHAADLHLPVFYDVGALCVAFGVKRDA